MDRANGEARADEPGDSRADRPQRERPNPDVESGSACPRSPSGVGEGIHGDVAAALPRIAIDAAPDVAVFRDIIKKAAEGNIKYQELYLKYINLISGKMVDEDEVIYEATFIDDEDKET